MSYNFNKIRNEALKEIKSFSDITEIIKKFKEENKKRMLFVEKVINSSNLNEYTVLIYPFGSVIRGDSTPINDIDFVIFPKSLEINTLEEIVNKIMNLNTNKYTVHLSFMLKEDLEKILEEDKRKNNKDSPFHNYKFPNYKHLYLYNKKFGGNNWFQITEFNHKTDNQIILRLWALNHFNPASLYNLLIFSSLLSHLKQINKKEYNINEELAKFYTYKIVEAFFSKKLEPILDSKILEQPRLMYEGVLKLLRWYLFCKYKEIYTGNLWNLKNNNKLKDIFENWGELFAKLIWIRWIYPVNSYGSNRVPDKDIKILKKAYFSFYTSMNKNLGF